jgi:hypothetical protein
MKRLAMALLCAAFLPVMAHPGHEHEDTFSAHDVVLAAMVVVGIGIASWLKRRGD